MKFSYAIGNPPYQIETAQKETNNGEKTSKRIFGDFQKTTETIANNTCLIYPAGGWILGGSKGLKEFGHNQINDKHLQALKVYKDATDVFPGVGIGDGISIVLKDLMRERESFDYWFIQNGQETYIKASHPGDIPFVMDPKSTNIINKIIDFVSKNNLSYLNESILPRTIFGVESCFVEDNPDKVILYKDQELKENEIKLYANDKAGKAGRTTCYIIDRQYIPQGHKYIDLWKVIVSSANFTGSGRDRQLAILGPKNAFGRSRICIKAFESEYEAQVFKRYLEADIIRFCLLMTGGALTVAGKLTPDLLDYSKSSLFNLDDDFDKQFQEKLNLTKEEINYVHDYVVNNTTNNNIEEE